MYCLSESLLVKTPSCLAGILPREGAGKASAERPNENVQTAAASCPFKGKDVRRTERGLIPLCEGWNINEKTEKSQSQPYADGYMLFPVFYLNVLP